MNTQWNTWSSWKTDIMWSYFFPPPIALSAPRHGSIPALMKFKSFPRCQLSDLHTWARPDGLWKIFGWIIRTGSLSSTQSMWNTTSPPLLFSFDYIVLKHERSVHTYDTQRTAIKLKTQILDVRLLWQSQFFFYVSLPSHYISIFYLCDGPCK